MKMITLDRRKIRMSLEGWYFTFVLVFIGTAAILRRANLLLILAAMLTAPILLNWRFVMASLRRVKLKRRVPQVALAGELFRVNLTIENESSIDSWHVQIDESIHPRDSEKEMSVAVVVDRVPFQDQTMRTYECLIPKRGIYEFGPSEVSTSYPMGLIRASGTIANQEPLLVGPELGQLTGFWREWTAPDEVDEPRSAGMNGIQDGMFYAIREFRQGDSQRAIHWRSTAKLGKPAVKQFEKQSDRELNLVADLFDDGNSGTGVASEIIISFVATLVNQVCSTGKCKVNLMLTGNQNRLHSGSAGPVFLQQVTNSLAMIEAGNSKEFAQCLDQFTSHHPVRGPILVVSTRECIFAKTAQTSSKQPASSDVGSPFPGFMLKTQSGAEVSCNWINVRTSEFAASFQAPAGLMNQADWMTKK